MGLTDHISLGVLTVTFPRELVGQVLFENERVNTGGRALVAHVVAHYPRTPRVISPMLPPAARSARGPDHRRSLQWARRCQSQLLARCWARIDHVFARTPLS